MIRNYRRRTMKKMAVPCIKCENAAFAYENKTVISDLTFTVNEGDYLCIIGENGTGKSTLMKGLLGLKKPVAGSVTLGEDSRTDQIGYVPQTTAPQRDFPASVWEVVLSGCRKKRKFLPGYGREEKQLAEEKMELLGISGLKEKSFRELSGGQRQRVLLARALCAAKKLILLDEPTTGLDPVASEEFYHLLIHLNRTHQMTVIMVSHAVREAMAHADHILYLSSGHYFYGTTGQFGETEDGRRFLRRCDL